MLTRLLGGLLLVCLMATHAGAVERFRCNASWYGPGFHGRITASGKVFDQYGLSAAHKSLPFGTMLQVINPANNASVIVRVNDRGPFVGGRCLDLSYAAAQRLGFIKQGTASVLVVQMK